MKERPITLTKQKVKDATDKQQHSIYWKKELKRALGIN